MGTLHALFYLRIGIPPLTLLSSMQSCTGAKASNPACPACGLGKAGLVKALHISRCTYQSKLKVTVACNL